MLAHPDSAHGLTEAAIRDAKSELDAVSTGVTSISKILAQRSAALEAVSKEITDMMKRAQALRVPGAAPQPEAIVKRLDSIVGEAKRLLQSAQQRLDRAAQLQNRLLVLQDRARTADSDLTEVGAERLRALIQVQQPLLWRVKVADIAASTAGSTYFIGQAIPGALQFLQDNVSRVVLHIGVFVAGFALVTYLRRRFGSETLGGRSARAATRPYSASSAVDAACIAAGLPRGAVERAADSRVAQHRPHGAHSERCTCEPELRAAVYALAGAFLLERLTTAFARDIVLQRMMGLVLTVAALGLFAWARSLTLDTRLGLGRYLSPFIRRAIVFAIAVSVASLLFNVLGNVDLALLLQTTIIRGAVLAAAQYAAVLVLDEISNLIVHSLKARGVRSVATFEYTILSRARRIYVTASIVLWIAFMLNSVRMLDPFTDFVSTIARRPLDHRPGHALARAHARLRGGGVGCGVRVAYHAGAAARRPVAAVRATARRTEPRYRRSRTTRWC